MRSGSFNVIYITLGGFTLLGHFCELFEMLTTVENWRQIALNSPQPTALELYTKAAVKANPPEPSGRDGIEVGASPVLNPCGGPMGPSDLYRRDPHKQR